MYSNQDLILEAAHTYLIHSPYVTPDKQLKWGDTLLSACKAIEALQKGESAEKEIGDFVEDLRIMIYSPIEAIASAYVIWVTNKVKVSEQEVKDLNDVLEASREMCHKDAVQAKRNLIGALNRMFDHLNKVDPSEKRQRLPFREELIPTT